MHYSPVSPILDNILHHKNNTSNIRKTSPKQISDYLLNPLRRSYKFSYILIIPKTFAIELSKIMNFLDFFDFITNSVMMPLAALATCILILRVVGIDGMVKEIEQSSPFRRKKLYRVFIKYFAPICLIIILLSSIANVLGIISM